VPKETLDIHGQAYAYVLWGAQLVQLTTFGVFFLFSRHIQIGRIFHAPAEVEGELAAEEQDYLAGEAARRSAGERR
jgi:hypothetical protein